LLSLGAEVRDCEGAEEAVCDDMARRMVEEMTAVTVTTKLGYFNRLITLLFTTSPVIIIATPPRRL
jgi:hypothetical protein